MYPFYQDAPVVATLLGAAIALVAMLVATWQARRADVAADVAGEALASIGEHQAKAVDILARQEVEEIKASRATALARDARFTAKSRLEPKADAIPGVVTFFNGSGEPAVNVRVELVGLQEAIVSVPLLSHLPGHSSGGKERWPTRVARPLKTNEVRGLLVHESLGYTFEEPLEALVWEDGIYIFTATADRAQSRSPVVS